MVIMAQSGKWMADWSKIKKCYISSGKVQGVAVMAGFSDGDQMVCGTYATNEQGKTVIGYLYNAIKDGDMFFEFPQPEELPTSKAYFGTGGGKRHGGS